MKSTTSTLVLVFIAFFLSFVTAAPLEISVDARDVYAPPVLSPNASSIWKIGTKQTVTWNITNPPAQITNPRASIILVINDLLDINHPLETDLDILAGSAEVVVPNVDPRKTYRIIVFGDSGNSGEPFKIEE